MKRRLAEVIGCLLLAMLIPVVASIHVPSRAKNERFLNVAGLNAMEAALNDGTKILKIYYDNNYFGAKSCFVTSDESEIQALWEAIRKIELGKESKPDVTDWYPVIVFYLDNNEKYEVSFENHLLRDDTTLYELRNDAGFWGLAGNLADKYMEDAK